MEPEALFQSVESGDRKLPGSEMMFVDTLHAPRSSSPPSSSSDSHTLFTSARSDDPVMGGGGQRRIVASRATKLIKDFDGQVAKQQQQQSAASSSARVKSSKKAWEPTLPNAACIGVHLVYEISTQIFGQQPAAMTIVPSAALSKAQIAAADAEAHHACYRLQLFPPQSPNMHWLQRLEELAEAVEEGVAALLLEDAVALPIVVPWWWRSDTSAGGMRIAVDESLVSAAEIHPYQPVQPVPPLKGMSTFVAAATGGKKHKTSVGAAAQVLEDPVSVVNSALEAISKQRTGTSKQSCCDVVCLTAQGLHVWAYQRTCGLARPEEALHRPIDLVVLHPPSSLKHRVVSGLYSLTPVVTPAAIHTAFSQQFGYDEAGMTVDMDVLTPADRAEAQRRGKANPTDDDLEHRAWLEGLLETPGHALYHLDLDLTLPVAYHAPAAAAPADANGGAGGGAAPSTSPLGFAEALRFNAVLRFLDDVSIVSLHLLHSAVYDAHGVPMHLGDADPSADRAASAGVGGSSGPPLLQIASDAVVWRSPANGRVLRADSKLRLNAFLVLDLRGRSGAHELQSTLATRHAHMHPAEWQQLTTVISSAQLDFVLRTADPCLCGGAQLLDCGVAGAALPALSKHMELRASVLQSELSSLHDAVHVGGPDDALSILREAPSEGPGQLMPAPPVVAPTLVCSGHPSAGGYTLWNFSPSVGSEGSPSRY
jgi:aspartate 1-decarboxylase